jgi:hypothetical protein
VETGGWYLERATFDGFSNGPYGTDIRISFREIIQIPVYVL